MSTLVPSLAQALSEIEDFRQAQGRKLLVIVFVMLKKGLDYWYIEDRLYNEKLRALRASA